MMNVENQQQNAYVLMDFPILEQQQPIVLEQMPQQNNGYFSSNSDHLPNNFPSNQNPVYFTVLPTNPSSSSAYFLDSTSDTSLVNCINHTTMLNEFGNIDEEEDVDEPMMRNRACTWPRGHFSNEASSSSSNTNNNLSVLLRQGVVVEGEVLDSQNGSQSSIQTTTTTQAPNTNVYFDGNESAANSDDEDNSENAWGKMSYAELITRAIASSPEQRLTLSQIYEWMVQNVPLFSNRGDTKSSAGWKNSIRHNLSLHPRFMRIQNEGPGRYSWWIVNHNWIKPSKMTRRRATMDDASAKDIREKKRRGAPKRSERQIPPNTWFNSRKISQAENDSDYESFRSRTLSNISTMSEKQVSFSNQSIIPQTITCNKNLSRNYQMDKEYSPIADQPVYSTNLQQQTINPQINQEKVYEQQIFCNAVDDIREELKNLPLNKQQDKFRPIRSNNYAFGMNRFLMRKNNESIDLYGQQPIEFNSNIELPKGMGKDLNSIVDFEMEVIDEFIRDELSSSSL